MLEVVLLLLLERREGIVQALQVAREEGSLAQVLMYTPVLDPLAEDERFRRLMTEAGLLLPRWSRSRRAPRAVEPDGGE